VAAEHRLLKTCRHTKRNWIVSDIERRVHDGGTSELSPVWPHQLWLQRHPEHRDEPGWCPTVVSLLPRGRFLYLPPCLFISVSVELLMMNTAQWHGEFIADLASQRFGLRVFDVVRVGRGLLANKTGLCTDKE
jgi:hypothetical protein